MVIDPTVLHSSASRGIFEGDADRYAVDATFREDVLRHLREIIAEEMMRSSIGSPKLEVLAAQLKKTPERSFNIIYEDMLQSGASWQHLVLLRTISGLNPVPSHHQGQFYRQVADWINWVEDQRYATR